MSEIYIEKPYIEQRENGLYRLCANITLEGVTELLFVEVEEAYKDYLTWERSDAFLFLTIPIAIREGYNIRCEAPVGEMFLHNITTTLLPALAQGDSRVKKIEIIAPIDNTRLETAGGVGASVTCGVDSTYTIMEYTKEQYCDMKLTHLYVASVSSDLWGMYGDVNLHMWTEKYASLFERYNEISEYTGLPIVKLFTNFAQFVTKRIEKHPWYRHLYVHTYITISTVLTLHKLFGTYVFSSAYDYSHFTLKKNLEISTADYELLLMHVLTTHDFMCFSGGATVDRVDKTVALADYPLARKVLHPCFKEGRKNCSSASCNKCLRALLTLDYYDKLEPMADVYDIKRYEKHREKYLMSLVKDKTSEGLALLYDMFAKKFPEDIKKAQAAYDKKVAAVSRDDYNKVKRELDLTMLLLSKKDPKKAVSAFFKEKGVKKLFYSAPTELGGTILKLAGDSIEVVTAETGEFSDCDAGFVGSIADHDIKQSKKILVRQKKKQMEVYTIKDIKKYLK